MTRSLEGDLELFIIAFFVFLTFFSLCSVVSRRSRWSYVGMVLVLNGEERIILDYNDTTKVATVREAWSTPPDHTSILALHE